MGRLTSARVLVDDERAKKSLRRGGARPKLALTDEPAANWQDWDQLIDLDAAMVQFATTTNGKPKSSRWLPQRIDAD